MASIESDLRKLRRAVKVNIERAGQIPLRTYTLHDIDRIASRVAMERVEVLPGESREEAQVEYQKTWRTPRIYKVSNLVNDVIEITKRAAGFIEKA